MNPAPEQRFTGMADVYDRSRPDYPDAVLSFLQTRCNLSADARIIDIGAGTGISTRWLARRGWNVLGIEPNDDMRQKAQAITSSTAIAISYVPGTGEATGLPDNIADLILCAQSFHWFDPAKALPEFRRVLKPGGWVALLWNERDESDPFTAAFGQLIRRNPHSVRTETARQSAWQAFMADPDLHDKNRDLFPHQQTMDEQALIGRALSMSHVPREGPAHADLLHGLRDCFATWQKDGVVTMRYQTSVFTGQSQ